MTKKSDVSLDLNVIEVEWYTSTEVQKKNIMIPHMWAVMSTVQGHMLQKAWSEWINAVHSESARSVMKMVVWTQKTIPQESNHGGRH